MYLHLKFMKQQSSTHSIDCGSTMANFTSKYRSMIVLCMYLASVCSDNQHDVLFNQKNTMTSLQNPRPLQRGKSFFEGHLNDEYNKTCFTFWRELEKYHIVKYHNSNCSNKVDVLRCYCLSADTNNAPSAITHYGIGTCMYGCFRTNNIETEYYTVHFKDLTKGVCANFNREGLLCGQCIANHSPAVYSFSMRCVECQNVSLWKHTLLYITVAYGPLTVFLFTIIFFTVSVNSAPLYGLIFLGQYISCSIHMRWFTIMSEEGSIPSYSYKILGTVYGIWNLDFFRSVYPPFCLHPSLNTLQVMSLDYFIAAYPLIIIIVLYSLVELHSRDCRPIVAIWKPFYYCFARFRYNLNIRTSLVDAFGTFFTLSYVKALSVTTDIMIYSRVWSDRNITSTNMYFDGTMHFFKGNHIAFAIVGILITFVFNILPLTLIIIYSFPKLQYIIHCFPVSLQNAVYPFMDNLLSCYKDGTNGTRNCRYFAIVYPIARVLLLTALCLVKNTFYYPESLYVILITTFLILVIRPYKSELYNFMDAGLMLNLAMANAGVIAFMTAQKDDNRALSLSRVTVICTATIPGIVMLGYLFYRICYSKRSDGIRPSLVSLWRKLYTIIKPMRAVELSNVSERACLLG